jgi:hypothetical protein
MQQKLDSRAMEGALVFLSWSTLTANRNDFWGRLTYSPNVFTEQEVRGFSAAIRYALEKLDGNTPADLAMRKLLQVQKASPQ